MSCGLWQLHLGLFQGVGEIRTHQNPLPLSDLASLPGLVEASHLHTSLEQCRFRVTSSDHRRPALLLTGRSNARPHRPLIGPTRDGTIGNGLKIGFCWVDSK